MTPQAAHGGLDLVADEPVPRRAGAVRAEPSLRVLHLTVEYPDADAPTNGIFVRNHVCASAASAEVAVVHLKRGERRFAIEWVEGETVPTLRVRYPRARAAFVLHFVGAYLGLRRLRRAGFSPDVVHAHFFLAALPPLFFRALFRVPVVVTEQWSVFLPEDPTGLQRPLAWLARRALPRAASILPVSHALRAGMEAMGIAGTYRVVPNVVDTSVFVPCRRPRTEAHRIVFVGRLCIEKGVPDLLRAMARLTAEGRELHLDVVGDGASHSEFVALVAELGITDRVTFHGARPNGEVAKIIQGADLAVLPSLFDSNPTSLIEAQACGLPAVATRVGGIPEIVSPETGLLCEPGDFEDLARALAATIDTLGRFDRVAIATRTRRRYGTERVAHELTGIYAAAVAQGWRS